MAEPFARKSAGRRSGFGRSLLQFVPLGSAVTCISVANSMALSFKMLKRLSWHNISCTAPCPSDRADLRRLRRRVVGCVSDVKPAVAHQAQQPRDHVVISRSPSLSACALSVRKASALPGMQPARSRDKGRMASVCPWTTVQMSAEHWTCPPSPKACKPARHASDKKT